MPYYKPFLRNTATRVEIGCWGITGTKLHLPIRRRFIQLSQLPYVFDVIAGCGKMKLASMQLRYSSRIRERF